MRRDEGGDLGRVEEKVLREHGAKVGEVQRLERRRARAGAGERRAGMAQEV